MSCLPRALLHAARPRESDVRTASALVDADASPRSTAPIPPRRRRHPGKVGAGSLRPFFTGPLLFAATATAPLLVPSVAMGQCTIAGQAAPGDIELARRGCQRATDRFTDLVGAASPAGVVELSDTVLFFAVDTVGATWKLTWPTTVRMREFFATSGPLDLTVDESIALQWNAVLPHELGHLLLDAEAQTRHTAPGAPPRLPDWLHEGTGVWMEPPEHRAGEFAILRALAPFIPSVRDILDLSIRHPSDQGEGGSVVVQTFYPCASEEACGGRPHWSRIFRVTTRQFPDGRVQVDTTFLAEAPPPPDPLASNAYAYSAALVRYLHEAGGAAALGTLLDRYLDSGGTVSVAALPGLPADPARVEAGWREWFEREFFVR